jgi:predicted nuclease of predicted toxin-antitoxin system
VKEWKKESYWLFEKPFDVLYVVETMRSASDDVILKRAKEENRILLTLDKDFGELVYRLGQHHAGVVLCRVQSLPIEEAVIFVVETITKYGNSLQGAFTVIQPNNVRIRKN